MDDAVLLVNFGGPRDESEIRPFLTELLCDPDVIRTRLPKLAQRLLFKRIAAKRSKTIVHEYARMGGRSPIFDVTESLAEELRDDLECPVLTFHRYLPATHADSLKEIENLDCENITVFPLFPQFSYATTGSIARVFAKRLSPQAIQKLRWIRSYHSHPAFIDVFVNHIRDFLQAEGIAEEDAALFFSPHGVPKSFICSGDPYKQECETSYLEIMKGFPKCSSTMAYQSKFGPEEWVRPYTDEVCAEITHIFDPCKTVVFVPLTFTSDHIETLVEVEDQYLPVIRNLGMKAVRCPAFNLSERWKNAVIQILNDAPRTTNALLVRDERIKCPGICRKGLCPYVQPLVSLENEKSTSQSANKALSTV